MKLNPEPLDNPTSAAVEGVVALCTPKPELMNKELVLCSVCLQWTCEGPHCHRPGVCEDND
jgi:hypothetical protein